MTTPSVRVFAPAKINLFLHVGEKRPDGYHALQSLVVFAEEGDTLQLARSDVLTLAIDGRFGAGLAAEADNLVLKAARALSVASHMTLTKNLPVASGIGGGSADAAAALRGLSRLWDLDDTKLLDIAASLGSDVPVCVAGKPAWMEGRGEILSPVTGVPPLPMLLVNPGVAVSTADIFRALASRRGTDLPRADAFHGTGDLLAFLRTTANDLEAPALALQPIIAEVLQAMRPGALLARMSGSGATCFALFETVEQAADAARTISAAHPSWWVRATRTLQ